MKIIVLFASQMVTKACLFFLIGEDWRNKNVTFCGPQKIPLCYLGVVKDHGALRVSGVRGRAGWRHLWSDEHRLLQPPEMVLTEDKVGQVARQTSGLEDFHLREGRRRNAHSPTRTMINKTLWFVILVWISGFKEKSQIGHKQKCDGIIYLLFLV